MRLSIITPLAAFALAACADSAPEEADPEVVPAAAETPPGYDLPDALDSPTRPSTELSDDGMRWRYDAANRAAAFGPPDGEPALTLRCQEDPLDNPRLVLRWDVAVERDTVPTVTMRRGADSETVRMEPVARGWQATAEPTGALANFLLAAPGPVTFTFGTLSEPKLLAPASDELKQVIQTCQ